METRLLVHYEDGWKALPYVWNSTQDEAFLELAGDYRDIELVGAEDTQAISYIVPDANSAPVVMRRITPQNRCCHWAPKAGS